MLASSLQRFLRGFVGLTISAFLAGCSTQQDSTDGTALMHSDFDSLAGWLGVTPPPSLTREKAHSGTHSIKVDSNTEYSIGYTKPLGQLSTARVTRLRLEAWVWVPSPASSALLVSTLAEPGTKPLSWNGFDVAKAVTNYSEWVHVSKVIDVPAAATTNTLFNIYLWRATAPQPIYLDDLTISAVK